MAPSPDTPLHGLANWSRHQGYFDRVQPPPSDWDRDFRERPR
jgi:hypothetical protein